jgi:arylsulfatase A-like enzyme
MIAKLRITRSNHARSSVLLAILFFVGAVLFAAGCSTGESEIENLNAGKAKASSDRREFKNVVIFLVDTLRADRLGSYGYDRDTSPNIDAFAADAVLFERAFSVSPWTRTSVASMFTSMYPVAHACQDKDDLAADALVMMAEILKANGFKTGGFSTNISVSDKFNMTQGFDEFVYFERETWFADHPGKPDPGYVPIEGMMSAALNWLLDVGDQPFFFYFHSTDPHWQYRPPPQFALWGDRRLGDLYDGEVRYTDYYFQEVVDHLSRLGKLDETLIIFTADHGEELFEHGGHGHGHTLYNELLQVPLIIRHPGLKAGRLSEIVRLIDVLPTIIDMFALEPGDALIQGRSLMPLLLGRADQAPQEQFVLAEVMYPSKIEGMSLEADGWKLIRTIEMQPNRGFPRGRRDAWEIYDMSRDPGEQENVVRFNPETLETTRKQLEALRSKFDVSGLEGKDADLDEETREALRSLGYVE